MRVSLGRDWMVALSKALPSVASVLLSVCAESVTSTSVVGCAPSVKSMVAGWLTSSSACLVCVPKPGAVTRDHVARGVICCSSYSPWRWH